MITETVSKKLYRTTKTLREVLDDLNLAFDDYDVSQLQVDTCGNCGIWYPFTQLIQDECSPGIEICKDCKVAWGLKF